MSDAATSTGSRGTGSSLRTIGLPVEHGGWGFTFEPVLLGLLAAPSVAAWSLAVAAFGVFLARRPVKLLLADLTHRRWLSRTTAAAVFVSAYALMAGAGLGGALATGDRRFVVAYAIAAPLAVVALYADARRRSRTLLAELAGSTAMGATVAAIVLADGWGYAAAFGLWLVVLARGLTSITLVRAQIRRVHDRPVRERSVYLIAATTVAGLAVAAAAGTVPWLSVLAILGIGVLARLSLTRPPVPARVIGWTQMAIGLMVVALTAIGVRFG